MNAIAIVRRRPSNRVTISKYFRLMQRRDAERGKRQQFLVSFFFKTETQLFFSCPFCFLKLERERFLVIMLISQDFFDETLTEGQELFDYDDEKAVFETIQELRSSGSVELDHLSLTHPKSGRGQQERQWQQDFTEALNKGNLVRATELLNEDPSKYPLVGQGLVLSKGFLLGDIALLAGLHLDTVEEVEPAIEFLLALIPETKSSDRPCTREVKLRLGTTLQEDWNRLYQDLQALRTLLVKYARLCCNACEPNKKRFVQAALHYNNPKQNTTNGLDLLISTLPKHLDDSKTNDLAKEIALLVTVLCKFQGFAEPTPEDGEAPIVSSAHATVLELHSRIS